MAETAQAPYEANAQEVVEELAAQEIRTDMGFERLTIQKVSSSYYVGRIYYGADDEYDGFHLDFS